MKLTLAELSVLYMIILDKQYSKTYNCKPPQALFSIKYGPRVQLLLQIETYKTYCFRLRRIKLLFQARRISLSRTPGDPAGD